LFEHDGFGQGFNDSAGNFLDLATPFDVLQDDYKLVATDAGDRI